MPRELDFQEPYQACSLQVILSSFQNIIRIIQGRIPFSVNLSIKQTRLAWDCWGGRKIIRRNASNPRMQSKVV